MIIERIPSDVDKIKREKKIVERFQLAALTADAVRNSEENRAIANDLCKKDWKYFVNNFVWIQDPEAPDVDLKEIPFNMYDFQEKSGDEIVKAIENAYDLPVEKSRKMGITWLVLAILLWGWHYHQWEIIVGSRKAEEVDRKGDIGTLFEKIRFMMSRLPDWMFTQLVDRKHDSFMKFLHPIHGASIVGEGNNPNFGRSDRRKVSFLDEFTSWEFTDKSAYQSLASTTKCRLAVSTPNPRGVNCYFYQVIQDARKKEKPYLSLPWWLHPDFSEGMYYNELNEPRSPWYDNEVSRASDQESVAQEIDINYEASIAGKVFPKFSVEGQVLEVEYDEDLPLYISWDFGLDMTAIQWIQPTPDGKYNIVDEYQNKSIDIYHYIDIIDSKGYKQAIHYGDPQSGENRQLTSGQSPANILRRYGIIFRSQRTRIATRVAAARNIVEHVVVSPKCIFTIEMFTSWQMRKAKTGSGGSIPDHSEHSHIGEAFTYFAFNYRRLNTKTTTIKKNFASVSGVTY